MWPRLPTIILAFLALVLSGGCDALESDGEVRVLWKVETSGPEHLDGMQPVVEAGVAYVAYDHYLRAFDAETGHILWSTDLGNGSRSLSSRKLLHDGGRDGRLYIHLDWKVEAYQKRDGRRLWSTEYGDFSPRSLIKMAQDAEYLYVAGHGAVQQVRKQDGALVRRFAVSAFAPEGMTELVSDVGAAGGLLAVPTGWSVNGDSVTLRGAVYAFDTTTGEERWRFEVPLRKEYLPGWPDSVYADVDATGAMPAGDRVVVTTTTQVLAFDAETGVVLWERFMPGESGFWVGPTVTGGAVYVGGTTQRVHKLDLATGGVLWTHVMDGSLTPIIEVRDGHVYFTNDAWGELWVLDDQTGRSVWHGRPPDRERTGEGYMSAPGVGDKVMVVVAEDHVYGLRKP